jgi:hypothetical protein
MAQLTDKMITFAYLRKEIDIPQNIPDEELDHKVYRAQERLRMLMGDEFYQDFLAKYKAGPFSATYQALYDPFIKQFIAWQACQYWTLEANFKPTRSGFRVHTEANSVATTDSQLSIILKDRKQQAEYYTHLLVDFLNNHASDYPLYNQKCNDKLTGNSFHISAVKNRRHDHDCRCNRCCHSHYTP